MQLIRQRVADAGDLERHLPGREALGRDLRLRDLRQLGQLELEVGLRVLRLGQLRVELANLRVAPGAREVVAARR